MSTARVYEIERAERERVGADVVSKDGDVRGVDVIQHPRLHVGRRDARGRADDAR
jgi:hypothetical protein